MVERKLYFGSEVVSPILQNDKNSWEALAKVCNFIKFLGGYTNVTCGGHIHIGGNILGADSKAWENFLEIWKEAEPIIYMLSNRRGSSGRKSVNRYAEPRGNDLDYFDFKSTFIKNERDLANFIDRYDCDNRYKGLNLRNMIFDLEKKTIEFRIPDGEVDYNIIRENILLYASILRISKLRSVDSSIKQEEWDRFFEKGLAEKDKVQRFLNLIFDSEKDKDIFRSRWEHNCGKREKVRFPNRTYKRQKKSPKSIKEQIKEVADDVTQEQKVNMMTEIVESLEKFGEIVE